MSWSCPGKVFVVGEYSCLIGGPALLLTCEPRFTFSGTEGFRDPYKTLIGVGSSSAQFILSVAVSKKGYAKKTPEKFLKLYWKSHLSHGGARSICPSGVDVVAQVVGGPVLVRNKPFSARKLPFFKGARFILAFTGKKIRTHEHLSELVTRGFPMHFKDSLRNLRRCTLDVVSAWLSMDAQNLGDRLNQYQKLLFDASLCPEKHFKKIQEIQGWSGVFGAKGSGAQGGDCVILLIDHKKEAALKQKLREQFGWKAWCPKWTSRGLLK